MCIERYVCISVKLSLPRVCWIEGLNPQAPPLGGGMLVPLSLHENRQAKA